MAFDTKQYVSSKFRGVGNTAEEIRAAAEAILADYGDGGYLQALGGARPQIWAQQALRALSDPEMDEQDVETARAWLTGEKQAKGAARELASYAKTTKNWNEKLQNVYEGYANTMDFSDLSWVTGQGKDVEAFKASAQRNADKLLADSEGIFSMAEALGLEMSPALVRTKAGWVQASSVGDRNNTVGRLGESTKIVANAGGGFDVVGSNSGTVYGNYPDESEAVKQQNIMQSGGTADATGAFSSPTVPTVPTTTTDANGDTVETPGSGSSTTSSTTADLPAGVDPADKEWIDGLYQRYFDRNATSAELTNWSKETPDSLESFMKTEATRYGYTSKYFQDATNTANANALAIIDNSTLPDELKTLWKTFVNSYEGVEVDQEEILSTFAKIKADTIDPYFKSLTDIAMADLQSNFAYLDRSRETEQEAERAAAGQTIRQAKDGLEAAGRTFTGMGIEQLGAESAYAQQPSEEVATPTQEPFGGLFYEGDVNQQNRMLASSSKSRYEKAISDLSLSAESSLGTDAVAGAGLGLSTVGGVQGDLVTEKQAKEGDTLNSILSSYYEKQNLNTNQTLT